MKAFAIASCIALLAPASALAAEEDTLAPGTRVRLTSAASPGARVQGTVHSLDGTTLTIINDDHHQMLKVPRAQLTKVEMGWGRRGRARKGLVIGALVGLAAGLLVVASDDVYCYEADCAPLTSGEKVGVVILSPALYGAIGAGIGALVKTDRWVEVPLDKVRVTAGPVRGGGVGASVAFRF